MMRAPKGFAVAVERAVAFHATDAVHDGEVGGAGQGDVHDALVDAAPVQLVLGPAVADAGERAGNRFSATGGAGPVMGLELG